MTQSKRITDYLNQTLFENFEGERENLGELIGKEMLIWDYATGTMFNEEGEEFEFVEGLFSDPDGEEPVFCFWSASKVIVDQLRRVPKDALPVAAEIAQAGKGNRKYYTFK